LMNMVPAGCVHYWFRVSLSYSPRAARTPHMHAPFPRRASASSILSGWRR
jgi:hypothetical protein